MAYESIQGLGATILPPAQKTDASVDSDKADITEVVAEKAAELAYQSATKEVADISKNLIEAQRAAAVTAAKLPISPEVSKFAATAPEVASKLLDTERAYRQRLIDIKNLSGTLKTNLQTRFQATATIDPILQKQVVDLSRHLATAQQEHLVAAKQALDANRAQLASLQSQKIRLASSLRSQQATALPNEQTISSLRNQIQDVTEKIETAQTATAEAGQALLTTQQEIAETQPELEPTFKDKLAPYMPYIIGGSIVVGGVIVWKVMVSKKEPSL